MPYYYHTIVRDLSGYNNGFIDTLKVLGKWFEISSLREGEFVLVDDSGNELK